MRAILKTAFFNTLYTYTYIDSYHFVIKSETIDFFNYLLLSTVQSLRILLFAFYNLKTFLLGQYARLCWGIMLCHTVNAAEYGILIVYNMIRLK